MKSKHTIKAELQALESLESILQPLLTDTTSEVQGQILLALHELCVNIIKHGYGDVSGDIVLELERKQNMLYINLIDRAPNQYADPDVIVPPNPLDLPESGWGMYIITQVMDSMHYEHHGQQNLWYLEKRL